MTNSLTLRVVSSATIHSKHRRYEQSCGTYYMRHLLGSTRPKRESVCFKAFRLEQTRDFDPGTTPRPDISADGGNMKYIKTHQLNKDYDHRVIIRRNRSSNSITIQR